MNNALNEISLVMFSTTAGHCGFKDIYKYALKHTNDNYGHKNFGGLYAAIKVHNNDEDQFIEMAKDYKGFNILKEMGKNNIANNPQSDQALYANYMVGTYSRSVANMFSWFQIETEFCLWQEDDCILISDENFNNYIEGAKRILRENKNVFAVHTDSKQFIKGDDLFEVHRHSFRPQIFRTKDMCAVAEVFKQNYEQIKYAHPEMIYEQIIKMLNPGCSFIRFNPKYLAQEHMGESIWPQLKEEYKLTL